MPGRKCFIRMGLFVPWKGVGQRNLLQLGRQGGPLWAGIQVRARILEEDFGYGSRRAKALKWGRAWGVGERTALRSLVWLEEECMEMGRE